MHCGETRGAVRANGYICATESGGEYREIVDEWQTHRWADWKPEEIPNFIKPEAKHKYTRTRVDDFQWAACEDTNRGHRFPDPTNADDREFFDIGRCIFCGIEEPTNA